MDPRKDVTVSKRSALNPNAPEFIPAFRSAYASANSSGVQNSASAKDSSVISRATNGSSNSISFNDQNKQYWESLLPDDITPEFGDLEDDLMCLQPQEEENKMHKLHSVELLAKLFPNFSEESVRQLYEACECDLNYTMESLSEFEHLKQNDLDTLWESDMHSTARNTMDSSLGSRGSIQVSSNYALDGVVVNENQLQKTSSIPQRIPQQTSQVAISAEKCLGTAGISNLGEPSIDISAQNAYFDQARKTNLSARELGLKGQGHDTEGSFDPCREGLVHAPRNMAVSQAQNAYSQQANEIKLQTCNVEEAIQMLRPEIAERRCTSCKTGQQQLLSIDMGSCLTIHESSSAPGFLLAVQQYLVEEENLQCSQEKSGELKVLISSQI